MAPKHCNQGHLRCKPLKAKDVERLTMQVLQQFFQLDLKKSLYQPQDIWDILITASVNQTTIEGACALFRDTPSPNTVRSVTYGFLPEDDQLVLLEEQLNQLLVSRLPNGILKKAYPSAADMTLIPYHGKHEKNDEHIKRSQAKGGTTHFHCYATLCITKKNKRYTLALTFVRNTDKALDVLKRLIEKARHLGWMCRRLCLDKEFDNNGVVGFLKEQPWPSLIPLKVTGKTGGTRALLETNYSYFTEYRRRSKEYGAQVFEVCVVCKYNKGKYKRKGMARFAYLMIGNLRMEPGQIFEAYRKRFGIESSYRQMNQLRAKTSSKHVNLRFFFMGIAFLLLNLWNFLKWEYLRLQRPGAVLLAHKKFPLAMFRYWLFEMIKKRKPLQLEILDPFPNVADY